MSSKLAAIVLSGLACALVSAGETAQAGNLNTSGVICQNYNASQALDIDYYANGVSNANRAARQVVCAVPRSPLAAGATATFDIDGSNNAGTCTSCTVLMYHYTGVLAASLTQWSCADSTSSLLWRQIYPLSTTAVDDYVQVLCTLPGSHAGTVFGITAVQP